MKIGKLNTDNKVIVIAEIGNNHEGNYDFAAEMISLAAKAGVDAVKFQTFKTEYYVGTKDKERFNLLKSFELKYKEFEKLSLVAKNNGVQFLSTPLDIESAIFLSEIVDAIKIASGDNNFYPLIKTIAELSKPIILSTGLANFDDIVKVKNYVESIWSNNDLINELAILHCVTSYPVESKFANLKAISNLIDRLNCCIGYSDHTIGIDATIVAVGLGARIIEKHFTKDKNFSDFRDHKISADPDEMKSMINSIREVEKMLGDGEKVPQLPEKEISIAVRRSIVAKRDLLNGTKLDIEDITWIRPGGGLGPGEESKIIGKKLKTNIDKGSKILLDNLE